YRRGSVDENGRLVDAGQRILRRQLRVARPVGINVVGVLKGDLAFLRRAAAERQVATGDEDQITIEPAIFIDRAAAIDGGVKAVVAAQRVEGCRGGEQLGGRSW